jgi:hypothetical protein
VRVKEEMIAGWPGQIVLRTFLEPVAGVLAHLAVLIGAFSSLGAATIRGG